MIWEIVNINDIKKEIIWTKNSTNNLEKSVNSGISKFIKLYNWTILEVIFKNQIYIELLREKFDFVKKGKIIWKLYFEDVEKEIADGIIDINNNIWYVSWEWFWILKSAISWLATILDNSNKLPIHWSALLLEDRWICLIGWHGAGKTTWIINIANILWHWEIVSDDWLIWESKNDQLLVSTTDNSISLSEKSFQENSKIFIDKEKIEKEVSIRKRSYKPESILWENYKLKQIRWKIDKIILLTSKNIWESIVDVNKSNYEEVINFILWATYHYPYYNNNLRDQHHDVWSNLLNKDKISIHIFNNYKFKNIRDWYEHLVRKIF